MLDLKKYHWLPKLNEFLKTPLGQSIFLHCIAFLLMSIRYPDVKHEKIMSIGVVTAVLEKGKIGDKNVVKRKIEKLKTNKDTTNTLKNSSKPVVNESVKSPDVEIEKKIKPKLTEDFDKLLNDVEKKKNENTVKKDFDNLLKDVTKKKQANKSNDELESVLKDIKKNKASDFENVGEEMRIPMSDELAIKQQIYSKWSIPSGIKNAEKYVVDIEVKIGASGDILRAEVVKRGGTTEEKIIAESAIRAVLLASPLKLMNSKKIEGRKFILRFDLKEALS